MSFVNCLDQQDHEVFRRLWEKLTVAKDEVSRELRLKKPCKIRQEPNDAVHNVTWILFLALPQLDDNGNITKILVCTTDISDFKVGF
jgi:hypothetical protein